WCTSIPIYFAWFMTALLFGRLWCQNSQRTAKWAPFYIACNRLIATTIDLLLRQAHDKRDPLAVNGD
ncbi:MAG: hypothetical protein WB799_13815, partial [Candidatus Sulfotelmatobacter sp.]